MATDRERFKIEWYRLATKTDGSMRSSKANSHAEPDSYATAAISDGDTLPAGPNSNERSRLESHFDKSPALGLRGPLDEI